MKPDNLILPEGDHELRITLLENSIPYIEKNIKEIKDAVVGNGKVGLKTEVEVIKETHKLEMKGITDTIKRQWYIISLVLASILCEAFMGFFQ